MGIGKQIILCKCCEKSFLPKDSRGTFCSSSCAVRYNNKRRILSEEHREHIAAGLLRYAAANRDNPEDLERRSKAAGRASKFKHKGRLIKSILETSKRTQRKIIKRIGLGCSRILGPNKSCGWTEGTGDIHHIRGRKIPDADNHTNLTYLCPNCHRVFHEGKIGPSDVVSLDKFIPNDWKDLYYG